MNMRFAIAVLLALYIVGFMFLCGEDKIVLGQTIDPKSKNFAPTEGAAQELGKEGPQKPPENISIGESFDQKKSDIETLKIANLPFEGKFLLEFFQKHTVTGAARTKLSELIRQLGDDDFDRREQASEQIESFGYSSIGMLHQAERSNDPEVVRRCKICLKNIEKTPNRIVASAAARLVADLKPEGATEALLNYLPMAEDDIVGDQVRGALAAFAIKDGAPDPFLRMALESKETIKRGAAAEAFARCGDNSIRADMRQMMAKESDTDVKLRIALALVWFGRNKAVVEDMIKLMAEAPADGWRAEKILTRLAEGNAPSSSVFGADRASREKSRDEWLKWWKENEKTIDLAKLDETKRLLGYTLIIETGAHGGSRVKEITPDGKVRWEITNAKYPTDALVLPGNRVLIAEQRPTRVSERDTSNGKEVWATEFNQPIGLQRLDNGNIVVIGRFEIIEWDRDRKVISKITRQQPDICAGAKLQNGNFAVFTIQGQMVVCDKDSKEVTSFPVGPDSWGSTMQVLPNGKVLVTQRNRIVEVDVVNKKIDAIMTIQSPTCVQKLPDGNILLTDASKNQFVEIDPKSKKIFWEYEVEPEYRPRCIRRR
jgi:hypothetical protein